MKHERLDTVIVGIINASDWPLYTDNVLDKVNNIIRDGNYTLDLPDRSLLLRRLNKLASEGRIYKSGSRDFIKWTTTNPRSLDRIWHIKMQRKSDHKRATAAFIALGFGTHPDDIVVPSEPSEDDAVCESCSGDGSQNIGTPAYPEYIECSACNGYGTSKAQQEYEQALAKREALQDGLDRECGEHFVRLTTKQFLSLVSKAKVS